jgi:hypothetical protein
MFARCANPHHTPRYCRTLSFVHVPFLDSALIARYRSPASFFDAKWLGNHSS